MKIKDLEKGQSLGGIKVKTPKGVVGYWKSQWQAGVWLSDGKNSQIYPQFVNNLTDCMEWEVASDSEEVNCHIRNDYHSIDNTLDEEVTKQR